MGKATGVELKAAFKKAAAWGTAVACGADDGLLILPHSIKKSRPNQVDDSLGLYWPQDSDPGEISVEGDLPAYLRYDGLDLLIALVMGATGGAPALLGTTAYSQTFTLASSLDGLFGTFALNNQVNIDEYTSVKVAGLTLKGQVGQPLQITFHCVVNDRITDSSMNTDVTFANVTYRETANRVLWRHGVIRMNDQSGAALAAGDQIYPASFELEVKRAMEGVYALTNNTIDEPSNSGIPEVSLSLEFPRYTADTYFQDWDANTPKKLDMTFTGALIESTYYRKFTIQFPHLNYAEADLPIEAGILKHPLKFNVLGASSAPSGMTGITLPFQVDVVNQMSTDVLA